MPSSRLRPDAVNWRERVVWELKSDSPKRIAEGHRQVAQYKEYLVQLTGKEWTAVVDVYKSY